MQSKNVMVSIIMKVLKDLKIPFTDPCDANYTGECCSSGGVGSITDISISNTGNTNEVQVCISFLNANSSTQTICNTEVLNITGTGTGTDTFATLSGNIITFADGSTITITDDQIASEVPFTPIGNTLSTNVQAAIEEIQTEIDNLVDNDTTYTVDDTNEFNLDLSLTNVITASFANQPTTGGSTSQLYQFNDVTDTYSWADIDSIVSNYAITNLIADGNRIHNWSTFDQTENFTTGIQTRSFTNGAAVTTIAESSAGYSHTVTNGSQTSTVFSTPLFTQINSTGTTSSVSQFVVRDDYIALQLTDAHLQVDAFSGNDGDVLTSKGGGTTPLWLPANLNTVARTDIDLTIATDLLTVHTNTGVTITLPAGPSDGQRYTIKQRISGTIINGNGKTIDGIATYTLPSINQSINVVYDGIEWVVT